MLGMVASAKGDSIGYGGLHDCSAKRDGFVFRHVHDWSWPDIDKLLDKHGGDPKAIFSKDNTFSFVELVNPNGKRLFRGPSPALTHLWISPDAEYLVGISNVKLSNPYQLVVWRSDGSLVHARHVSFKVAKMTKSDRIEFIRRFPSVEAVVRDDYFVHESTVYLAYWHLWWALPKDARDYLEDLRVPNPFAKDMSESVTNWVWWFDGQDPAINLERAGDDLFLTLRSRKGRLIRVCITTEPPKLLTKP